MERKEIPPITAVFLVVFDQKADHRVRRSYTIAWKRSLPDIDLDGVEYKSLPSGLHAVPEDLVYFVHGGAHAGVSAFVQAEADAQHRHAHFVAVGALVPLSYGQLGKSWVHAEELRALAKEAVAQNGDGRRSLELFWTKNRVDEASKRASVSTSTSTPLDYVSPTADGKRRKRARAMSEATLAGFDVERAWPADHPALQVPAILDTFGPLLFPLHRAALARKRVLLLRSPPVQASANAVYVLSVLSSIPRSQSESLLPEAEPFLRARPLFNIGIYDIPSLAERRKADDRGGWLACTTDDILREKTDLYDLVAELPSAPLSSPQPPQLRQVWPQLRTADGKVVKASQRDLRRWTFLRRELRRLRRQTVGSTTAAEPSSFEAEEAEGNDEEEGPLLPRRSSSLASVHHHRDEESSTSLEGGSRDESAVVESTPWSALAYRGFMWWASAGEASAWETDEAKSDEELLFDMPDVHAIFPDLSAASKSAAEREAEYGRSAATLLVAYFRRVTEGILATMTSIVEEADDETEGGVQEDEIQVTGEDLRAMGLDGWSEADKTFVRDMMKLWFDRDSVVVDQGTRICGVRIC